MIQNIDNFKEVAQASIDLLNTFASKHKLQGIALADHICYKCSSTKTFEQMRAMFEDNSEYIHQSIISKRRIAYIKLNVGMETDLGVINYVELSDQKPDGSQTNDFDHIEIFPVSMSYNDMVEIFEKGGEPVVKKERPHHTTHDIDITPEFLIRLEHEPLIDKIKREEMK